MYDNTKIFLQPLIITVEENETVLDDTADKLGFEVVRNFSFLYICSLRSLDRVSLSI